jgi:hypothetical protein
MICFLLPFKRDQKQNLLKMKLGIPFKDAHTSQKSLAGLA